MKFVVIGFSIAVLDCIVMGLYSLKKKEHSTLHKYALFIAWSLAICMIASSIDSSESILYAIPIILAVRY